MIGLATDANGATGNCQPSRRRTFSRWPDRKASELASRNAPAGLCFSPRCLIRLDKVE